MATDIGRSCGKKAATCSWLGAPGEQYSCTTLHKARTTSPQFHSATTSTRCLAVGLLCTPADSVHSCGILCCGKRFCQPGLTSGVCRGSNEACKPRACPAAMSRLA